MDISNDVLYGLKYIYSWIAIIMIGTLPIVGIFSLLFDREEALPFVFWLYCLRFIFMFIIIVSMIFSAAIIFESSYNYIF